jgi:hypothetical protein
MLERAIVKMAMAPDDDDEDDESSNEEEGTYKRSNSALTLQSNMNKCGGN